MRRNANLQEAKTVGEATSVQLKVVVPLVIALVVGAFTIGTLLSTRLDEGKVSRLEREKTKLAEAYVGNLDLPDQSVRELRSQLADVMRDSDLSRLYNLRGLRIYRLEEQWAQAHENTFRQSEVRRALAWFDDGRALDQFYPYALWNSACMSALLGEGNEAVGKLSILHGIIPNTEKGEFTKRFCTDTDFCPITVSPPFQSFMASIDCAGMSRHCPTPPKKAR